MFSGLSNKDLNALWSSVKLVHHSAGKEIISEGRGGVGFHLIVNGEAKVSRKGKNIILGRGQFFGELSLIDDGPRTATVSAHTEMDTAVLTTWNFKSIAKANPEMAWKLLVHLTHRLREEQSVVDSLRA